MTENILMKIQSNCNCKTNKIFSNARTRWFAWILHMYSVIFSAKFSMFSWTYDNNREFIGNASRINIDDNDKILFE